MIQPFYFGSSHTPVFGVYHAPEPPRALSRSRPSNPTPTLIVPAIGQCAMRSHWVLHQLAEDLCQAGIPVLRFDWLGDGDSFGELQDYGPEDFKKTLFCAFQELRDLTRSIQVDVVAIRQGATLAWDFITSAAVADSLEIQRLVLWDPLVLPTDFHELLQIDREKLHRNPRPDLKNTAINGFAYSDALKTYFEICHFAPPQSAPEKTTVFLSQPDAAKIKLLSATPQLKPVPLTDGGYWSLYEEREKIVIAPKISAAIFDLLGKNQEPMGNQP